MNRALAVLAKNSKNVASIEDVHTSLGAHFTAALEACCFFQKGNGGYFEQFSE